VEENPYESPRTPEPLTKGTIAKRVIGVGAIVALTPFAVLIAFGASCAAVNAYVNATLPRMEAVGGGWLFGIWFISAWSVFLLPPAIVLGAMIWWAVRHHSRNKIAYKCSAVSLENSNSPQEPSRPG